MTVIMEMQGIFFLSFPSLLFQGLVFVASHPLAKPLLDPVLLCATSLKRFVISISIHIYIYIYE